MSAPLIEPMPPMTMTTKAKIRHRLAHADLHRLDGADERAGKTGKRGPEREDDGVELGNVDTERCDHFPVVLPARIWIPSRVREISRNRPARQAIRR
jgi:hypothetical protein